MSYSELFTFIRQNDKKIFNEWNTRRLRKGCWCRSESAGTLTERRRQPVAHFKPTALEDHLSAPFLLSFALVLHSLLFSSSMFFLQDFRVWTVNWWCKTNAFKRQRFSFCCCHAVRDEATRWRFTTIGSDVYKSLSRRLNSQVTNRNSLTITDS